MKNRTVWVFVALIVVCCVASAAVMHKVAPGVTTSNHVRVEAAVLKVFGAEEGDHRFVAYAVEWNDQEVVVSDPLARSSFQVGNQISFLAHKITIEKSKDSVGVTSLSFTLLGPSKK